MNLIKDALKLVDFWYAALTIPLLLIVGAALINFLPVPTLIGISVLIWGEFVKADHMQRVADFRGDPKFLKLRDNCISSGITLAIATVLVYGVYIYLVISSNELCKDYSDHIPGTLPALLQKVVPHTC